MILNTLIKTAYFIVFHSCEICNGTGKIEHPIIVSFGNSSYNSWYEFFTSCGMPEDTQPPRFCDIPCEICNGTGIIETQLSLLDLVNHVESDDEDDLKSFAAT